MSNLFDKGSKTPKTYTANDIEVLEGLEAVRKRPGMYVGGTDITAYEHLVKEVFDNSMDEALSGYATEIHFHLGKDNIISVRDNGRGIPIDPHPKFPTKSALEIIFTTLHSGGKFGGNAYGASGGLHGVGVSVVNALSSELTVRVVRDGKSVEQIYSRGKVKSDLHDFVPIKNFKHGTEIIFQPDKEIFGKLEYSPDRIYKLIKAKAYLNKGIIIYWSCDKELLINFQEIPSSQKIFFPNGLIDYLKDSVPEGEFIGNNIFSGNSEIQEINGKIEWVIIWSEQDIMLQKSYCNTINTPHGGTHEAAFKSGILKGVKIFAELVNPKRASQITADDVFFNAHFIISIFMKDAQFSGQTKEKLISTHISKYIENIIKTNLEFWLTSNKNVGEQILEHIFSNIDLRLSRKKEKEVTRKSITQKLRLPGKLADCTRDTPMETEIFIVEGDSAGGSAKQGRNRELQAVLPLRGKILNVANSSIDKISANQEINDLCVALGCGTRKNFDIKKLRYEKIIIMTDADVDGAHISSLLMTFFLLEMPELVEKGHLYLAQPPLYKLTNNNKTYYAKDENERDKITKKFKGKVDITRFKGLGEMTAAQLKETTMNSNTRILIRISLDSAIKMSKYVESLMGRKADFRFNFIQEQALSKMDMLNENFLDI